MIGPFVVTLIVCPVWAEDGADVIVGRVRRVPSVLNRYGGLKIWPSGWLVAQVPHRPPPPEKTRAVGEQDRDGVVVPRLGPGAIGDHRPVLMLHSSGVRTDVESVNGTA